MCVLRCVRVPDIIALMRVRFAPSPTGFLHLGGLRTALFNYLIAKKHPKGKFVLRIEDTDRTRLVPGAVESLQQTLRWAGIDYDEGPDRPGPYGPYIQSERLEIYKEHAAEIMESGKAYRCFCSKERLELVKGLHGNYDGACRGISPEESNARASNSEEPFIIRFKTPTDQICIVDQVFGALKTGSPPQDVVLMKSDGYPTYHFANVIDDHLMKIDLVMRGAEWIPSTPLHALLYKSFNWQPPKFAHLPLLINPDGSKLSKRQASAHVSFYMSTGILPSALNNFVSFLGWTPRGKEVLGMTELIEEFELSGLNNSDSTVNFEKLKWLNRQHLKLKSHDLIGDLGLLVTDRFNTNFDRQYLEQVIKASSDRIFFLKDIIDLCSYYFINPDYNSIESQDFLSKINQKDLDSLKQVSSYKEIKSWPLLRLILTGCKVGPAVQDTIKVLGYEVCEMRLKLFKEKFGF